MSCSLCQGVQLLFHCNVFIFSQPDQKLSAHQDAVVKERDKVYSVTARLDIAKPYGG